MARKRVYLPDVEYRIQQWIDATGLVRSYAYLKQVFPGIGLKPGQSLNEFDHQKVFFCRENKIHVVLVEPYHTADKAIDSAAAAHAEYGLGFSCAKGPMWSGIHYPGHCHPVVMAKTGFQDLCARLAEKLPEGEVILGGRKC